MKNNTILEFTEEQTNRLLLTLIECENLNHKIDAKRTEVITTLIENIYQQIENQK